MTDRVRDGFVGLLLASLALALPDVSAAEGRAALALAILLLGAAMSLARRPAPGIAARALFLVAVLFLALQPFAAPEESTVPLPARAMVILGVALALWAHMNIQSVSGKLAWVFSRVDVGVMVAGGTVVLASLTLLWLRPESRLIPQILVQGMAVTFGVVYLYGSRWRPDRPTFAVAAVALAGLLGAAFGTSMARDLSLGREWETQRRAWTGGAPSPERVEALVREARLTRPQLAPRVLAAAAVASAEAGRPEAALAFLERPGGGDDLPHPWLARSYVAETSGDPLEAEEAMSRAIDRLGRDAGPPEDLGPVPPELARTAAVGLLDRGRPDAALRWIDAAAPGDSRYDLTLLRAEALLGSGLHEEAERVERRLAAEHPDRVEPLLGVLRARLASGDRDGARGALADADALGAPEALLLPLRAGLSEDGDARRRLAGGIEIVARDDWPDRHPNGNFLYGEQEDRRITLLLMPGGSYELLIEARGEPADGSFPRMIVEASGEELARPEVASRDWDWYPVPLTPPRAALTVRLRFANDFSRPDGPDRNLVIGAIRLRLPAGN